MFVCATVQQFCISVSCGLNPGLRLWESPGEVRGGDGGEKFSFFGKLFNGSLQNMCFFAYFRRTEVKARQKPGECEMRVAHDRSVKIAHHSRFVVASLSPLFA